VCPHFDRQVKPGVADFRGVSAPPPLKRELNVFKPLLNVIVNISDFSHT
jgi:hypothetical protein